VKSDRQRAAMVALLEAEGYGEAATVVRLGIRGYTDIAPQAQPAEAAQVLYDALACPAPTMLLIGVPFD
jgi:hypothetical protein